MINEIKEEFDKREKEEREKLINSNEFKKASPIMQTEFLLALRLKNTLRL
jgi:hypothetical protein